jgi:hypothetical protein
VCICVDMGMSAPGPRRFWVFRSRCLGGGDAGSANTYCERYSFTFPRRARAFRNLSPSSRSRPRSVGS